MNTKVKDLMTANPEVVRPDETVAAFRDRLLSLGVSAMPVADAEGKLAGIVTTTDLLRDPADDQTVADIMSSHVYTVPPYADIHIPARIMRNHGIHHVVVALGDEIQGVLTSYDLLQLVEQHRFVAKGKPVTPRKGGGRRRKLERELARQRKADEELTKKLAEEDAKEATPEEPTRERLEGLLAHLSRRTAGVERARRRGDGLEADFAEQAVVRENDEVLDALSREGEQQIALLGHALERLDSGDYGKCEQCGAAISEARLNALPYASTCIDCARKAEG